MIFFYRIPLTKRKKYRIPQGQEPIKFDRLLAGLNINDTAIPHFKIQITEIPLAKKRKRPFPPHAVEEVIEYLGLKHPIIFDVYNLCHNYHCNKLSSFNVSVERHARVFRNTLQIYRSKKRPFSQGFSVKP